MVRRERELGREWRGESRLKCWRLAEQERCGDLRFLPVRRVSLVSRWTDRRERISLKYVIVIILREL